MAFLKPKDCGNICQFLLFILAAITGVIILVIALMMNSKYSPQAQQQPLVVRISSLSVSHLNTSNSVSEANWDAKLLFGNRHRLFEIFIESFESFVCYNQKDALSCAIVEPMHLGAKRQKLVQIKFNASGRGRGEQPFIEDRVLKEIKKDGENGTLHIGLMLNLQIAYKKGPWSWVYEVKARCSDLDVLFESEIGEGIMVCDEPKSCFVPVLK